MFDKPNYGHHRSDRMAALLSPVVGIRDAQARAGITPRDHAKDNRMRLKEMQLRNRERKEAATAAAVAASPRPPAKLAGVGSRVAAQLARPASVSALPPRTPPEPRNFACPKPSGPAGRVFTAWAPPPLLFEGTTEGVPRREKRNPPVPTRAQARPSTAQSTVDFVRRNTELCSMSPRKTAAAPSSPPGTGEKSRYHGRLPPYLLDRKLELAKAAEAKVEAARPRECPEGTHVLEEGERQRVLGLVRSGQERLHAELDAMPFVVDSYGLKAKHLALSKQLQQLEAAEKAFSRDKVIVANEDPDAPFPASTPPPVPMAPSLPPPPPAAVPAPAADAQVLDIDDEDADELPEPPLAFEELAVDEDEDDDDP